MTRQLRVRWIRLLCRTSHHVCQRWSARVLASARAICAVLCLLVRAPGAVVLGRASAGSSTVVFGNGSSAVSSGALAAVVLTPPRSIRAEATPWSSSFLSDREGFLPDTSSVLADGDGMVIVVVASNLSVEYECCGVVWKRSSRLSAEIFQRYVLLKTSSPVEQY